MRGLGVTDNVGDAATAAAGVILAVVVCCTLWPSLAGATVSCADWNTEEFFQKATAADVTRCIAAGMLLTAQKKGGRTSLHVASALYSESPTVIQLLDAGAKLEARGAYSEIHPCT